MENKVLNISLLFLRYFLGTILLMVYFPGQAVDSVKIMPFTSTPLVKDNSWKSLTLAQQQAFAPLANDWDNFTSDSRKKWLLMENKFQKMSPDEQKRILEKMQAWTKLTPEQRLAARENYLRSNKLLPEQRTQKWQEYQQLTEEQKEKLAKRPERKNLITNLPNPEESKVNKLQPLKTPHSKVTPAESFKPTP